MMSRRIVVTGMGVVTPIGNCVAEFWQALLDGRSGVGPVRAFAVDGFCPTYASEVKDLETDRAGLPRRKLKVMGRHAQLAFCAAQEAWSDAGLAALAMAGHPIVRIELKDKLALGEEFFRWEVATATAGSLLGIDAFDQPNVQESKDNTNRLLAQFIAEGKLPEESPSATSGDVALFGQGGASAGTLEDSLTGFLKQRRPNEDYIVLMAYLESTPEHDAALKNIRMTLRNGLCVATTFGYGPRFLHSTGQLHKGGPNHGLFIQITADDAVDLPEESYRNFAY